MAIMFGNFKNNTGGPTPTALPQFQSKRRSIKDILADTNFNMDPAYDEALASGESFRRREETAGVDNVLNNLQGRGLATSGIALKDIVTNVLGPSEEKARSLAAQFGLEKANRKAGFLEQLGLGDFNYGNQYDLENLGATNQYKLQELVGLQQMQQLERQRQIEDQRAKEARSRRRRGGLGGLAGGILGGVVGNSVLPGLGGIFGANIGSGMGSAAGDF